MKISWEPILNESTEVDLGSSDFGDWGKRDYQGELDDIPIEEIERYLRKKKLERIKGDES